MSKSKDTRIQQIIHNLRTNMLIYNELPVDNFEEHIGRLIKRLRMQKNLFIKEISRVFKLDENSISDRGEISRSLVQKDKEQRSILENDDISAHIPRVIRIEEDLHKKYYELLMEENLGEIARMIIKNQSNEIKRDIRGLKNILEYV